MGKAGDAARADLVACALLSLLALVGCSPIRMAYDAIHIGDKAPSSYEGRGLTRARETDLGTIVEGSAFYQVQVNSQREIVAKQYAYKAEWHGGLFLLNTIQEDNIAEIAVPPECLKSGAARYVGRTTLDFDLVKDDSLHHVAWRGSIAGKIDPVLQHPEAFAGIERRGWAWRTSKGFWPIAGITTYKVRNIGNGVVRIERHYWEGHTILAELVVVAAFLSGGSFVAH